MRRTGPSNPGLQGLIKELKKKSSDDKVLLWKKIALELEKPTRRRRVINLSKIGKHVRDEETILVPGKVLGTGDLNHKVTIAAYNFSASALEKIREKGGRAVRIGELVKENPNPQKIRILV